MRYVWLAACALLVIGAVGVYRAGLNEVRPPPAIPGIVFHGGLAHGQRLKTRSWSVEYDRAVSNADQTVFDLEHVRNGTIFRKGKPYLRVRAAHMSVNTLSHDFNVAGPLHIETIGAPTHRSFDTTSAVWNDAVQRLTLARPIVVHTSGEEPLSVGSLVFNVKTGDVEVRRISGPIPST